MSRLYDTVEPAVINDEMLQSCVYDQGPELHAGEIAKEEGINYEDVLTLRLDFRNILRVDNLWQFQKLVKLQLDNNIIEKIEGLETLVNLEWLDLSFNNIEEIKGLETLVKLKDLTLFNNRISTIENLEALTELHVLSIGNNRIGNLEQIVYLRQFKQLRTLNMSGNPICADENYKLFAIAYLPHVVYLDFRLVDADTRNRAHTQYENLLGELMHHEKLELGRKVIREEHDKRIAIHKKAFVEQLDGPDLFNSMYSEDPEGQKISNLPGIEEVLEDFETKFVGISKKIFAFGLEQAMYKQDEVQTFRDCMEEAKEANKQTAVAEIAEFQKYQNSTFQDLLRSTDQAAQEQKIREYTEKVAELTDALMGFEMKLVDQMEDNISIFERNLAELMATFVEHIQEFFAQLRELENHHNEKLLEMCVAVLEKLMKGDYDQDLPDNLRALFVDKDTIVNAIAASHDVHLVNIDNREDEIMTKSGSWTANLMQKIHREELIRNRSRIQEISTYVDHVRDRVYQLDLGDGS